MSNPKFSKHEENSNASTIDARGEGVVSASANGESPVNESAVSESVDGSMAGRSAERQISRRQFGRNAAAAIAAAATVSAPSLLAVNAADAQTRTQKRTPTSPSPAQTKPEPLEGLTPEQTAEVEARLANILRKYGSRFTADQKTHLRGILAQNERMMEPVRAFALQNGDPPASVLRITFDGRDATNQKPEKDGR